MRSPLALLCLFLCLAAPVRGQLVEESHPELGLIVTRPKAYSPVPLPPRESLMALAWMIPTVGEARPATLSVSILSGVEGPADTRAFLDQAIDPDTFESLRGGARRYGMDPVRFSFERRDEDGNLLRGLLLGWEGQQRHVVVLGECLPAAFDRESKRWTRMFETLRMNEPRRDERGRSEWERFYAKGRYRGEGRRIEERMLLTEGWEGRDTIHYLVLANGAGDSLLRRVAKDLETLRARLARDLPPPVAYDSDAASVVRICSGREEYLAYGGLPSAVGYFSPTEAELVLYVDGSLELTMETLYHEAFHQYVFHSTGGVAPQPWFDEGMGEYYAGAQIEAGRVQGIEPLRGRLESLRAHLAAEDWTPLVHLIQLDRQAYYQKPDLHYSQGWSLVRFLRTAPQARGRDLWGGLLDRYYKELALAWSQELERARERSGRLEIAPARARALKRAMGEAFRGVDLDELEGAWKAWIQAG